MGNRMKRVFVDEHMLQQFLNLPSGYALEHIERVRDVRTAREGIELFISGEGFDTVGDACVVPEENFVVCHPITDGVFSYAPVWEFDPVFDYAEEHNLHHDIESSDPTIRQANALIEFGMKMKNDNTTIREIYEAGKRAGIDIEVNMKFKEENE